jgi:hypothetical protein
MLHIVRGWESRFRCAHSDLESTFRIPTNESIKQRYDVDEVHYTQDMVQILKDKQVNTLFLNVR